MELHCENEKIPQRFHSEIFGHREMISEMEKLSKFSTKVGSKSTEQ